MKIKRDNSPSPHSYLAEKVKDKIMPHKIPVFSGKMNKAVNLKFIDQILKEKKQIPGVGYYKNLEKSLDYRSKGSLSRFKLGL